MAERHILLLVLNINEHRVAMVEGAAAAILAGEPYRNPFNQKRTKGQSLGHAVVQGQLACTHLLALLQQFFDFRMDSEIAGIAGQPPGNLSYLVLADSRGHLIAWVVAAASIVVPIRRQLAQHWRLLHLARFFVGRIYTRAEPGCYFPGIDLVFLRIDLIQRRMRIDLAVKQWLGDGGIIHLAMAVAAVADQVNQHVTAELVAVPDRESG